MCKCTCTASALLATTPEGVAALLSGFFQVNKVADCAWRKVISTRTGHTFADLIHDPVWLITAVSRAQLLEKSEAEDNEQRQNEVFWKIDIGATDKNVSSAPLDRGARLTLQTPCITRS